MSDALLKLAERCEAAEGADRELDSAIALGLPSWTYGEKAGRFYNAGPKYDGADDRIGFEADDGSTVVPGNAPDMMVPDFTASLDAAMTLVPEGWRWIMREACPDKANPNERGFFARLETRDFESVTWGKGSDWLTDVVAGQDVYVWAATPALALCAAALRARASLRLSEEGE